MAPLGMLGWVLVGHVNFMLFVSLFSRWECNANPSLVEYGLYNECRNFSTVTILALFASS